MVISDSAARASSRHLAPVAVTAEPAGWEASGSEAAMSRRSGEAGQDKAGLLGAMDKVPVLARGLGRGCGDGSS